MIENFSNIKGILFDLDGVLYVGGQAIEGAQDTLMQLKRQNIPCRFITNTSTRTAVNVASKLQAMGFSIELEEIFSAVSATRKFLLEKGAPSVHLLVQEAARSEFSMFDQHNPSPDYVVVGDIGAAWNYALLNRVFNELMSGAELIAMHMNKFWQTEQGLQMDIGAFVAGLEFVSGKQATVIGKPSQEFFSLATHSLGLHPSEVLIVGDDIENDIGGGRASGLVTALVQTGKYREELVKKSEITPDAVIKSVAELGELLGF
jgi:HAD superfamily hydrolase (TIGR01458 family)